MFFPGPLPESVFRGSECRSMLKSAILERFSDFRGSQNGPSGLHFRPKGFQSASTFYYVLRPGAAQGATCDPNRPRDRFSSILDRFWMDFGPISDGFPTDFLCIKCMHLFPFSRFDRPTKLVFFKFGIDFQWTFWKHVGLPFFPFSRFD